MKTASGRTRSGHVLAAAGAAMVAMALAGAQAKATTNTATITLTSEKVPPSQGRALAGSTFAEIDAATDGDTALQIEFVPGLPDLALDAQIEVDAAKHALTIQGAAEVLGVTGVGVLVTADWTDADTDTEPVMTFGAQFSGIALSTLNDSWTDIGGESPQFGDARAIIASTGHTLDLAALPASATAFYGADADGFALGPGLNFRGALDLDAWEALDAALGTLAVDASQIGLEGAIGSAGLLFDNANADKSSLALAATVNGASLPAWMTESVTTVGFSLAGGAPAVSLDAAVTTDFGGATNTFTAAIAFDPAAYGGGTVTADFGLAGPLDPPFGADFLTFSSVSLAVSADLAAPPPALGATLTADVERPDGSLVPLSIAVSVDGASVAGDFFLGGAIPLGQVLGMFQGLLGFDATALATDVTLDNVSFSFVSGTPADRFEVSATATVGSLATDVLVAGAETAAGNQVLVGLDVTQLDSGCGCIRLGELLGLPAGSAVADLELPEVHLLIPLAGATVDPSEFGPATQSFLTSLYGALPPSIVLDEGVNLAGTLPLDGLGTTVRDALGFPAGAEVVIDGALGVSLSAFAGGGSLDLTGLSLAATLPPATATLPAWAALNSSWTLGVEQVDGALALTVGAGVDVTMPGDSQPTLTGAIEGVVTKAGPDVTIHAQAGLGAWDQPFGLTWLSLDDVVLALDYQDEAGATTVDAALSSSFLVGGKAFTLDIAVMAAGGDWELVFGAGLDDTLTVEEVLQFLGVDTTAVADAILAASVGPISLTATVASTGGATASSVALGGATQVALGGGSIAFDLLVAVDGGDFRLGLRAASDLALSSIVPNLPSGIDFDMPSFALVLSGAPSTRAASTLPAEEFAFFAPLHGCAPGATPAECPFDLELAAGLGVIANAPLPPELDELGEIGIDTQAGVHLQGTIPAFGSGDIALSVELPPWAPAGTPDWFKSGSLLLGVNPTSLDLSGELAVRLPKAESATQTCAADESQCDILTFDLTAELLLPTGPSTGLAFDLQGGLQTVAPWEQAFGIEWLTINQLNLQVGVTTSPPSFALGFLGDVAIGGKDISISMAAGITPAGIPVFEGLRAASAAGLELTDIVALQNQVAPGSPVQLGPGLPNLAIRDVEVMFAITQNDALCLAPGLVIAGDIYLDPTSPPGPEPGGACVPTPATPDTSQACVDSAECLASVRLGVSDEGITGAGLLSAFDLGPITFEDALVELSVTDADQHLTLSGGVTIDSFGSGALALTFGPTEFSFDGEVQLFGAFFSSLSGTATLDANPDVHVAGTVRQELVSAINDALRPFFEDFGAVVTVINGIIDDLQDPNKSLDDVASRILTAPAELEALGIAVPQWLIQVTDGINDGLESYADLTGTPGPFSSLLNPILTGVDFTISSGVAGTIVPRSCVGTWKDGKCWTITPTPASSYKVNLGFLGSVTVKTPAIPGVPGVIVPQTCLVVTIGGTCYAVPPLVLELPGLCDIAAVNAALNPCNATGLKNAIVGLLEDGFETITGVTVNNVQATLQSIADAASSPNVVLIDAPCIGFDLDLGAQSASAFDLDFHMVLFNQDIYFTDLGWDFGAGVGANASGLQTRLLNVLLGIESSDPAGNLCEGVAPSGGSSTPVGAVAPPSNVALTPASASIEEGSPLTVTGTFEPGSAPSAAVSVTIGWGDGQSTTVTPTGNSFTATHTYADDNPTGTGSDVHQLTAVVTNAVTGTANGSASVTVVNVAPTIDTLEVSPATVAEGGSVTLSGSYSDAGADTHTLAVAWGDGSVRTATVSGGTFSLTKQFRDDIPTGTGADTYVVSAVVTDDDLGASAPATAPVTVTNAAPTIAASLSVSAIDEGGQVFLDCTIEDAGLLDLHEVAIDWGDGTDPDVFALPVGGRVCPQATHVYVDDDPTGTPSDVYQITATVTDDDQGAASATQAVTVGNVAPSDVTLRFGSIVLSEGDETGVFITFTDPGAGDVHTVTVDWGDNSASSTVTLAPGTRQELLLHRYEDDNPTGTPQDSYPISVTIADDDGGSVTQAVAEVYDPATETYTTGVPEATISNVAPSFPEPLVLTPVIDENGTAQLSGAFLDPGLLDTFELVIDWGDGAPAETLLLGPADRALVADPDTGLEGPSTLVDFAASHQYLDDHPTATEGDAYTVTVTVTDDDTGTGTTTASLTVNDVAPVVEAAPASQAPQYSDPLADGIVLTAYDVAGYAGPTETLAAATEWSSGGGAFQGGLPARLGMVSDGCAPGGEPGSTAPRQACRWTVSGIADVAPGVYTIRFTVTDDDGLASTTEVTVDVQAEDARAQYTGPTFAATASAANGAADIELRATVRDISAADPGDAAWDPDGGDITNAIVDFVDRETGGVLCTAPVTLLFAGDPTVGTAACEWHVELPKNADASLFEVGTIVRGWYVRDETDDDAVVTVAKPLDEFVTGGGYIAYEPGANRSAGAYAADDGTRANFGFNVKFNKKGTNLQGRATVIVRSGGHVYKIKTNALQSLGVVDGAAQFEAKANVTDVTDEANPVGVGGNLTFQMRMTDVGEPNDADTIGWTLYDSDGALLFSSDWTGVDTAERVAKGNLVVHD